MSTPSNTIYVPGAKLEFIKRSSYRMGSRDGYKSPRMYVSVPDETLLDNLANRKRRPYNVYKTLIHSSGISSVLNLGDLRWSQKAGCTCPCSPGFILPYQSLEIEGNGYYYFDVWATLLGAPSVDERKAPRELAGV